MEIPSHLWDYHIPFLILGLTRHRFYPLSASLEVRSYRSVIICTLWLLMELLSSMGVLEVEADADNWADKRETKIHISRWQRIRKRGWRNSKVSPLVNEVKLHRVLEENQDHDVSKEQTAQSLSFLALLCWTELLGKMQPKDPADNANMDSTASLDSTPLRLCKIFITETEK